MSKLPAKRVYALLAAHLGEIVAVRRFHDEHAAADAFLEMIAEADFDAYACYEILEIGVVDRTKRGGVRSTGPRCVGVVTSCTDPNCTDHFHGHDGAHGAVH